MPRRSGGAGGGRSTGDGSFAAGGEPVTLVTPSGPGLPRPAHGGAAAGSSGLGQHVNGCDHYLRGVVPLEIPALWSTAAVRAQSVAARTYAAYERDHPRSSAYDICDTWSCQVYGGVAAEHPGSDEAIEATRRLVLHHDGEPAFTQFGSSSGGWTVDGWLPYLTAQHDPYDDWSGNPIHDWTLTVTDARFEQAFPRSATCAGSWCCRATATATGAAGSSSLRLVGCDGRVTVSGDTMRSALGLKSTWVSFRVGTGR